MKQIKISLLLLLFGITVYAQEFQAVKSNQSTSPKTFQEGANCLFIGHSFFIPVAKSFNKLAEQVGYANHQMDVFFAGGQAGLPSELWNNIERRESIEEKLSSGNIELLGMPGGGRKDNTMEEYKQWIELALKFNPNTSFFIGQAWVARGPSRATKAFDESIEIRGEKLYAIVTELRQSFPNTNIYFINYGKAASIMKSMFEKEALKDIEQISGKTYKALFSDRFIGHAGPMLLDVSALSWIKIIYGTDFDLNQLTYNADDVSEILKKVLDYNQEFKQ